MASSKKPGKKPLPTDNEKTASFEFDVVLSFLDSEKSLALSLESQLRSELAVFVYATRQQVLAGTDGIESFREVFRSKSRIVVVLFSPGWGETRFTRIEEIAIRDRGFNERWEDFLLFVTLNDHDDLPKWLPEHHIRLSYEEYGFEQLIGAIRYRARVAGAESRTEDSVAKAVRLQEEARLRRERREALAAPSANLAVQSEIETLFRALEARLAVLRSAVPNLKLDWSRNSSIGFEIRAAFTSIRVIPDWGSYAEECKLQAFEVFGSIKFAGESGSFFPGPKLVGRTDFSVDFDQAYGGWCWRSSLMNKLMTSSEVAEAIAHRIADLEEQADKGEFRRGLDDYWPGG